MAVSGNVHTPQIGNADNHCYECKFIKYSLLNEIYNILILLNIKCNALMYSI